MPWLTLGAINRELRDGDTVVGSGADADWRVTNADLTGRHFVVHVRGGDATVEAASADEVVAVDGLQVAGPTPLREGTAIRAGSGRFVFSVERLATLPAREEADEMAYLVDDIERIAHPLSGRSTPIGRDASNAVLVRDPSASRFHAEIRREAGGFAIRSMGAMGTLLNGYPVEHPAILKNGDLVEIAFTKLRFDRQAPSGMKLSSPGTAQSDEATRRPTLEPGERVVVDDASPAGRHTRRVQILIGLGVVLAGVLWWMLG